MQVSRNKPVSGVYAANPSTGPRAPAGPAAPAPAAAVRDVSSVLGIPSSEFTPRVRDAIMKLMGEVDRLRQELQQQKKRLSEVAAEADQDVLTPCLNRRAFVREMSRVLSFVERYGLPASMVYVDLDGFKAINDRLGHAAGDAALVHVCETIKAHIRESDVVGRLGGDEFGVILAKADQALAEQKAEMLDGIIKASPLVWNGEAVKMAFTTGAYEFRAGENPAEAMARADQAMYERKRRSRARA